VQGNEKNQQTEFFLKIPLKKDIFVRKDDNARKSKY